MVYIKRGMRTDQVTPALIEGTRQHRRGRNMMETMSKRNYVIGAREPIGGDRSPRRYRNRSDEYPLPVVKRNGVGKSSEKERSMAKRKEAIVTPSDSELFQCYEDTGTLAVVVLQNISTTHVS